MDKVVDLLEECKVLCLVVVEVKSQISADLLKTLLASKDRLMSQNILALLLLNLLVCFLILTISILVRERARVCSNPLDVRRWRH